MFRSGDVVQASLFRKIARHSISATTQLNSKTNISIQVPRNLIGKLNLSNLATRKSIFRICGSRIYFKSLYSQIQFGGVLLGTVLFGSLSDIFGRKPISLVAVTIGISFQIMSGLAPSWQLLLATRFFIGLSIGGTIVVVCTYVMEMILPQQRMALRAFFNWGSARLIMTLVCYFFPDWRTSSIALALIVSPMLLIIIFVFPESPTWLHNKGRLSEMKESEKKMARVAGIKYVEKEPEPILRKKSVLDLVKDGSLLKRVAVLWVMWFTGEIFN